MTVKRMQRCKWMANNFPQINCNKTEVILGPQGITSKVQLSLSPLSALAFSRNLDVYLDQHLNIDEHVKSLSRSCSFQLRKISKLHSSVIYCALCFILLRPLLLTIHLTHKLSSKGTTPGSNCCGQALKQNQPWSTHLHCSGFTAQAPHKI